MLRFGEIYWKTGITKRNSPDNHYIVILAVDEINKLVYYQTFQSGINKVLHFPSSPAPTIDVDSVTFLNYRKYSGLISRDTAIMMSYGVVTENLSIFEFNVNNKKYRLKGMLSDCNIKNLIVSLKESLSYRLSPRERNTIIEYFQKTK